MATKTYRALQKGYVDGRVIEEGEVFTTEFRTLVRDGKGEIEREKDGTAKTKLADAPTWAEPIDQKTATAESAAQQDFPTDPDLTVLDKAALQAIAIDRGVTVPANASKADLITAINAANDPTR